MKNRFEQVLLTYLRQWPWWLYVGSWVAIFPLLDVLPWWWEEPMTFVFVALAAMGPAAAIGYAKQQIADARASLMPDFRAPHVTVAAALSLAAIVLMPLLTHRALDVSLLFLMTAIAVAAIPFAAIAYFQSMTAIGLSIAALAISLPARDAIFDVIYHFPAVSVIVLVLALASLAGVFFRLARLREGMREYARTLSGRGNDDWSDARRSASGSATGPLTYLTRLQRAAAERRLRGMHNVFAAPMAARVRHWMRSGEMSGTKALAAALLALFLTGIPLFTIRSADEAVVAIAAVLSLLMPIFCVTSTWLPRRRVMGFELTRPASREQFVREFGLAMAVDLAEWWAWLTLAAIVPVLVWGPSLRGPDVVAILLLSAAEQVLALGILASVLRLRSPTASDGSIMMSVLAVLVPVMATAAIPRTPPATLVIALGVAALGAALTYDAYRRWCEADLV